VVVAVIGRPLSLFGCGGFDRARSGAADAKKNQLKPWQKECWCIPPKENAAFVCAMEEVLSVYTRALDPCRPVVCLDESSRQVLDEVIEPEAMGPGRPRREDHEYIRRGTANLFMVFCPLVGWRWVKVTERRTRQDWAEVVRELVDVHFPKAEKIVLVMDNLNTHTGASLYKAFPPEDAFRLYQKLEIHYTPKHGSWLNMAECELSVLQRQCLRRRMRNQEHLKQEVTQWTEERNKAAITGNWRFKTADARMKLRRLYPI